MSTITGYDDLTHGQTKAVVSKMGGVEFALAFLRGEYELKPVAKAVADALLVMVGTISIAATTEKFVASEKFVANPQANTKVKILYLDDLFKYWFLDKIEEPIQGGELRFQKLAKASDDGPIIAELGGEEKVETTLTEMFSLMKRQGKGEVGTLLTNGYANIFYIRDINGGLRTLYVYWYDGGWHVDANSIEKRFEWNDGLQVFSRNFVTG